MGSFARATHEDHVRAFDIFVSAPMSAYADDSLAYKTNRDTLINLFDNLKAKSRFSKFFCPAVLFDDLTSFNAAHDALAEDFAALEQSQAFILYYLPPLPTRPSSVFVEAGMALAARIPSVYIVRNRLDLPYMLRSADKLLVNDAGANRRFSPEPPEPLVKIVELGEGEAPDAAAIGRWLETKARRRLRASVC